MPERPGSNDRRDEYSFQYQLEEEAQPALAIVESMGWVKGVDALELEPVQRVVDLEGLTRVLRHRRQEFDRSTAAAGSGDLRVTFHYEGYEVTVTPSEIRIREPSDDAGG